MFWLQIDDGGRIGEEKRGGAGGELEEEEEEEEVVVVVVVSNICSPIEVKGCLLVISSDMKKTGNQPTNQPTYQPINSLLYRCVDPSKMYPSLL